MDDVDVDNIRHKKEEELRRAKRKEKRSHKSADQLAREKRRKEHAQRVLNEHNRKQSRSSSSATKPKRQSPKPPPPPPQSDHKSESKFQSLFSERSQGFQIELNFRNAPPRPPVGPCFVGLGLDGELNDKLTKYKPDNAIEANYAWKLHAEPDLGVPLAPSAMDYEGCYTDPSKPTKKTGNGNNGEDYDELFEIQERTPGLKPLHPDDEAIIHWKGATGDTSAEEVQRLRDKARADARLHGLQPNGRKITSSSSILTSKQINIAKRNKDFKSRVLDEQNPFFMKKTTYLANDFNQKVHDFKSLAQSKAEREEETKNILNAKKKSMDSNSLIDQSFAHANQKSSTATGTKRKHPTKENVEAVYEIPLLPDDETWGHSFIHVVLDNLPQRDGKRMKNLTEDKLEKAFIYDVMEGNQSQRMECNLLVATNSNSNDSANGDHEKSSSTVTSKYDAVQQYDLDVIPLKEEDAPHSQYIFVMDEEKGIATYHPISSRVQLSSGRPLNEKSRRKIMKRSCTQQEIDEMEGRLAEIDADLADKHGLDHDGEGENNRQQQQQNILDDDSSSDDGFMDA